MFADYSYPVICTECFSKTVNFYEDHFGFVSVFEAEGFAILKRQNWPSMYLAVMHATHSFIPEQYRQNSAGMIINFPVHDVDQAYQEFYWEGLTIVNEPVCASSFGRKHFFIEDPNGILINVAQNIVLEHAEKTSVEIELR